MNLHKFPEQNSRILILAGLARSRRAPKRVHKSSQRRAENTSPHSQRAAMGKLFSKANKNGSLSKASKYFQSFEISELEELVRSIIPSAAPMGIDQPASIIMSGF